MSSRNAYKASTALLPNELIPVEIRFTPGNLTGDDYKAFVSHLKEQESELNRLSLLYTSDLELNLLLFHNDPNNIVHIALDDARGNARSYLPSGPGDVAHPLDSCAGGYIYNIPYKRPSEPQRQVGRNWGGRKNNWKKIVPGKRHILIPENEGYVPPKPKRKKKKK